MFCSAETLPTDEDFGIDQIDDFFTLRTGARPQIKSKTAVPVQNNRGRS